ncbi:MAG: DUF2007 domain-containing protein [Verrucomicrobiota bacterium]
MLIPSLKGFFAIGEAMSVDTRNMGFMMSLQHCNQGMIEVYRDREMARIGQLKGLLESEGIKTFVRNENVSMTEAAIPVFAPALCILDDKDKAKALELIQQFEEGDEEVDAPEIRCPACGEMNPGNFAVCWKCQAELEPPAAE